MLQNLIDSFDYTIKSCESLLNKEPMLVDNSKYIKEEIEKQQKYLDFLKGAKEKYTVAVNELYEESVVTLKDTLNTALKYVIFDKDLLPALSSITILAL